MLPSKTSVILLLEKESVDDKVSFHLIVAPDNVPLTSETFKLEVRYKSELYCLLQFYNTGSCSGLLKCIPMYPQKHCHRSY